MSLELYITLNENGELILEGDLLGNGRETLIEDTGGPTEWDIDSATDLPERVFELTHQAAVNEYTAGNIDRFISINHLVTHRRIVDDR